MDACRLKLTESIHLSAPSFLHGLHRKSLAWIWSPWIENTCSEERDRGWEAKKRFSKYKVRSQIHEHTILLRIPGIILRVSDLRFPYTIFTLQTSFYPLLLKEGGRVEIKFRSRGDCE
jgi:hypothetical protein